MVVQLNQSMAGPLGAFLKDERVDLPQPMADQLIASRAAARTLLPATRALKQDLEALALSLKEREMALDAREQQIAAREAALESNNTSRQQGRHKR